LRLLACCISANLYFLLLLVPALPAGLLVVVAGGSTWAPARVLLPSAVLGVLVLATGVLVPAVLVPAVG